MTTMKKNLEEAAQVCTTCHDQCVSACPVFTSTRQMASYPSRLAMIALELNRGGLPPSQSVFQSLQYCIGCNACLEACVYIDHPNDITPVVRWARSNVIQQGWVSAEVNDVLNKINETGTPYGDITPALTKALSALPELNALDAMTEKVILYADAATLFYAPEIVGVMVNLLQVLGIKNIQLAQQVYPGGELWQFGSIQGFENIARKVVDEIVSEKPSKIIAISPLSAYLLRVIYPIELGLQLKVPVVTLAEVIAELMPVMRLDLNKSVYLVLSSTESYQIGANSVLQILETLGIQVKGIREELKYSRISYPEGGVTNLEIETKRLLKKQILTAIQQSGVKEVLVTSAEALDAFQSSIPNIQVFDLASYCSKFIQAGNV